MKLKWDKQIMALAIIATGLIVLAAAYFLQQWQIDRQNHRWCSLLTAIDYPRNSSSGAKFRNALLDRERDYGCIK